MVNNLTERSIIDPFIWITMKNAIKKPSNILLKLCEIGWIQGIFIEYKQTGTDTSETFVTLTGSKDILKGLWRTYSPYLDVEVGHCYVAKIKQEMRSAVTDWKVFEQENKEELAEYKRLQAKFN